MDWDQRSRKTRHFAFSAYAADFRGPNKYRQRTGRVQGPNKEQAGNRLVQGPNK